MSEPHPAPRPAPAALPSALNRALLQRLLWREWQHHPWRHLVALFAVALGVALAWSVHLINVSALAEFSAAVRSANGEPDAVLRGPKEGFDDRLLDAVAALPGVAVASPVVEVDTYAAAAATAAAAEARGEAGSAGRLPVRLIGLDALAAATLTPGALPRPAEGQGRLAALDPSLAFVNAAARDRLGLRDGQTLRLQTGPRWQSLQVGGSVAAGGTPLVVVDIAAAQHVFGLEGRIHRIDLRLEPGVAAASLQASLPAGLSIVAADEAEQRVSHLSRAYRVNLTVLALVALFVGAFLVYSVVSLSVAQRTPSLALLGVLGLTAGERRALVLAECGLLGLAGSAAGLALGSAVGVAAWLGVTGRFGLRQTMAIAGALGGLAGAGIVLAGGRLLAGSLDLLAREFPASRLRLDGFGALVGEAGLGPVSHTVSAAAEGALFASCVVGAMLLARRQLAG